MSLGDILESEIRSEIARIGADATAQAAAIVSEAKEKASNMLDSRSRALDADYNAGLTRTRSAADLESNAQRLNASDTLQVKAFQEAEQKLKDLTTSSDYPQVVSKLIAEGLQALPTADVIETSSAEQHAVNEALAQLGRQMDVKVNEQVKTGVRLVGPGGKTSVQNTLLGRLNSGRAELSAQVSRLIAES